VVTQFGPLRRGAAASLLAALAVIVTGCTSGGGGADPTFTPPTSTYKPPTSTHSTSPAPTTTPPISTGPNVRPGEKPPTLPAVGKTNTAAGALAFADYWMRTLDWGYATTDSSLAKAAFLPTCSNCMILVKQFDDAQAKDRHFRGGRSSVLSSALQANDHHDGATAVDDVTVSTGPLQVLDNGGHVVDSAPATPSLTFRTWLKWQSSAWQVADWKEAVAKK